MRTLIRSSLLFALPLLVAPSLPAHAGDLIGRVVAVRGSVTAQSPGEAPRSLRCDDPIYKGDRLRTGDSSRLGVMAEGVYAGLDHKTEVEIAATGAGAPMLDLDRGHLRVLDTESGPPARIETPGLLAFDAGRDTEALVFPEKAWTVSMVCPYDNSVPVSRVVDSAQRARPGTGQCAIDKPKEPLFVSPASHPRLSVIDDVCDPGAPVAGRVGDRFGSPADVALGPDVSAPPSFSLAPPIGSSFDASGLMTSCSVGDVCAPRPGPGLGTSPFIPVRPR